MGAGDGLALSPAGDAAARTPPLVPAHASLTPMRRKGGRPRAPPAAPAERERRPLADLSANTTWGCLQLPALSPAACRGPPAAAKAKPKPQPRPRPQEPERPSPTNVPPTPPGEPTSTSERAAVAAAPGPSPSSPSPAGPRGQRLRSEIELAVRTGRAASQRAAQAGSHLRRCVAELRDSLAAGSQGGVANLSSSQPGAIAQLSLMVEYLGRSWVSQMRKNEALERERKQLQVEVANLAALRRIQGPEEEEEAALPTSFMDHQTPAAPGIREGEEEDGAGETLFTPVTRLFRGWDGR